MAKMASLYEEINSVPEAPSFGELVEQVRITHNYSDIQAYAYLASAFYAIARNEDVVRIAQSIGISNK